MEHSTQVLVKLYKEYTLGKINSNTLAETFAKDLISKNENARDYESVMISLIKIGTEEYNHVILNIIQTYNRLRKYENNSK